MDRVASLLDLTNHEIAERIDSTVRSVSVMRSRINKNGRPPKPATLAARILPLLEAGMTSQQVIDLIDAPRQSIVSTICRLRSYGDLPDDGVMKRVYVYVSEGALAKITAKADQHHQSSRGLMGALLEHIATDDLFGAVIEWDDT